MQMTINCIHQTQQQSLFQSIQTIIPQQRENKMRASSGPEFCNHHIKRFLTYPCHASLRADKTGF